MPIAMPGSSVNVNGSSNAVPMVAVNPGSAPTAIPITTPMRM